MRAITVLGLAAGLVGCSEELTDDLEDELAARCAVLADDDEPGEPVDPRPPDGDEEPDDPGPVPEDQYLVGDWNGDGVDNLAVRRGHCILKDIDNDGLDDIEQCYGNGNDEHGYAAGDWDGNGVDDILVRREHCLYKDINGDGAHDVEHCYGNGQGEDEYLFGDWNGDGTDDVAVRRDHCLYKDFNGDGIEEEQHCFGNGNAEDEYLVGDWNGDGIDDIAVRREHCVHTEGFVHCYGNGNAEDEYLVGDWNGDGVDDIAVRRGACVLKDTNGDGLPELEQCYGHGIEADDVGDLSSEAEAVPLSTPNPLRVNMRVSGAFQQVWLDSPQKHYIAAGGYVGIDQIRQHEAGKSPKHRVVFYEDSLTALYLTGRSGKDIADEIWLKALAECQCAAPRWILLNEVSQSRIDDTPYRKWLVNLLRTLKNKEAVKGKGGRKIILASPRAYDTTGKKHGWDVISKYAFIGVERYISGREAGECLKPGTKDYDVGCLENKYELSLKKYQDTGIERSKLLLIEHFGQTPAPYLKKGAWVCMRWDDKAGKKKEKSCDFGRAGIGETKWINLIKARAKAARRLQLNGFVSYGWSGNDMDVSTEKRLEFAKIYMDQPLP